jgi:hypothetical protein
MLTVQLSVSEAHLWIFGSEPMVHTDSYTPGIVPMVFNSFYSWKDHFLRELSVQIATMGEA